MKEETLIEFILRIGSEVRKERSQKHTFIGEDNYWERRRTSYKSTKNICHCCKRKF